MSEEISVDSQPLDLVGSRAKQVRQGIYALASAIVLLPVAAWFVSGWLEDVTRPGSGRAVGFAAIAALVGVYGLYRAAYRLIGVDRASISRNVVSIRTWFGMQRMDLSGGGPPTSDVSLLRSAQWSEKPGKQHRDIKLLLTDDTGQTSRLVVSESYDGVLGRDQIHALASALSRHPDRPAVDDALRRLAGLAQAQT